MNLSSLASMHTGLGKLRGHTLSYIGKLNLTC
jgi:hypothetical protein